MDIPDLIIDLKDKLAAANRRLVELSEQRRPHALGAVTGVSKAKRAIEKIDAEFAATRCETDTLATAIEEAEREKAEREAKAAAEDRRRREKEARKICRAILEKDVEVDEAAATLNRLLSDRDDLIRQLSSTRVVYHGIIKALQRKRNVTGALVTAGLRKFVDFELVGHDARRPLAETDKSLRKPLITADDTKAAVGPATSKRIAA